MPLSGRTQLEAWLRRSCKTARELATESGIPEAYISQIRNGKRRPGLPKALALEAVTGIPARAWLPKPPPRIANDVAVSAGKEETDAVSV